MANDTSRIQGASTPVTLNSLRDVAFRSERAEDSGSGVDGLFRQTFDSQREQLANRQQALQTPTRNASADNRKPLAARRQETAARAASESRAQAATARKTSRTEAAVRKPAPKNAGREESRNDEDPSTRQSTNSPDRSVAGRPGKQRAETVREAGVSGPGEDSVSSGRKPDGGAVDATAETSGASVAVGSGNAPDAGAGSGAIATEAGSVTADPGDAMVGSSGVMPDGSNVAAGNTSDGVLVSNADNGMIPSGSGSQSDARLQEVSALMRSLQPVEQGDAASSIDGLQQILARLEQVKSSILPDQSLSGVSDTQADTPSIQELATPAVEGDDTAPSLENLSTEEVTVTLSELGYESSARANEKQAALAADAVAGHEAPGGSAAQHAFFRANSLMASSMQLQWAQTSDSGGEKSASAGADLTSAATPGTVATVDAEPGAQAQSGGQQGGGEGESPDAETQEQVRLAQWQSRNSESLGKIGTEVESAFGRVGSSRESRFSETGSSPIVTDVRSLMLQRDADVRQLQAATPVTQGDPLVPGRAGFAQAMGERIMMLMTQKVTAADIVLDPRELGPVEVKIRQDKDQTTLMFASHHPAVREQLEASLPKLRDLFSQAGLSLGNVSVGDRQAGGSGGQQGGQERWQGTEAQDVMDSVQPATARRKPRDERAVDFYA